MYLTDMPDKRILKSKPLSLITSGTDIKAFKHFPVPFLLMPLSEILLTYQNTLCDDSGRFSGKLSLYQTVSLFMSYR